MMDEAAEAIRAYGTLFIKNFTSNDPIDLTAVVDMNVNKKHESIFIGPAGGGTEVTVDG